MTNQKGFKVTVEGQYYSVFKDGDGHQQKKIKNYQIEVVLPSMEAALSIIRNYLLDPALAKKYPDYTKYRTHVIKHVESTDGATVNDIRYMSVKQLQNYIRINGLKIDTNILTDMQELREAINRYEENPDAYQVWFLKIADEKKTTNLLSSLNPELFNQSESIDGEDANQEQKGNADGAKKGKPGTKKASSKLDI